MAREQPYIINTARELNFRIKQAYSHYVEDDKGKKKYIYKSKDPVSFDDLAETIAWKLKVPEITWRSHTFNLTWDQGNWVEVKNSYQGHFSSPYAGRVRFDPHAPETLKSTHDFLDFLAKESKVSLPEIANNDDVFRLFVEVVCNDDAGDYFFDVLSEQNQHRNFDLASVISSFQKKDKDGQPVLPGAESWNIERIKKYKLDLLLNELSSQPKIRAVAQAKLRDNRWENVIHDNRHFLLFGQNTNKITPKSWFDASWDFINHFRCNFGMFVTEAMLYDKVTIIGAENAGVPVSNEDQSFLEKYTGSVKLESGEDLQWRQVERLNVINAEQLSNLLQDRIRKNVPFEGGDIQPLA